MTIDAFAIRVQSSEASDVIHDGVKKMEIESAQIGGVVEAQGKDR